MKSFLILAPFALSALLASACTVADSAAPASAPEANPPVPLAAVSGPAAAPAPLPGLVVHKSPTCGCCSSWITHMENAGHPVQVVDANDMGPIKQAMGVPAGMGSCHTAVVEGYFIEGHVPAQDVARLLRERPQARGLAVPGMPIGSPGMEIPSGEVQPYTVYLVNTDGSRTPFSEHGR